MKKLISIVIFYCFMYTFGIFSREIDENEQGRKIEQIKIGNFALSGSQRPAPLLGFGQNIIDKDGLLVFIFSDVFLGHKQSLVEVSPFILYGIRDDLSIGVCFPVAAQSKSCDNCSSGPEDFFVQGEYACYSHETEQRSEQITVVASLFAPTGSIHKNPATGFGSPSFFLGFTASHMSPQWYGYLSSGAQLTTSHKGTKAGNKYLYQAGFGKNITYRKDRWLMTLLIEFNGTYSHKDRDDGVVDENSGGDVVLLCPSIWFSTQKLGIQIGIGPVAFEHLFGCQNHTSMGIFLDLIWTFK